MKDKLYLGRNTHGEAIYIEKHSWDCGWYWGFGYLGNKNMHYHFSTYLDPKQHGDKWTDISTHFSSTKLDQDQWWILLDLFKIAYAYKDAAAAMCYGGHMSSKADPYRIKADPKDMNNMLEMQLDNIWQLLTEWLS